MAILFEQTLVTPGIARRWLDRNHEDNRKKKDSKVPAYARDMAAGLWRLTGESIKFDTNGALIDGQNRLLAVILSKTATLFDVAYDVPVESMLVLDTGASRTAADVLRISVAREIMRAAAIVRWALLWDAKVYMGGSGGYRPTHSEVNNRFLAAPPAFDAAAQRATDCQRMGLGTGAPAGLAHYLFSRIDGERAKQFFDQYVSGAISTPEKSPILVLRNRIIKSRIERTTRAEQLALFVRAWNLWQDGTPTTFLIISKGPLTNENFPQPK